ncbi:MAG: FAD-dependent oxidoreductase [Myxococcota bacterium]
MPHARRHHARRCRPDRCRAGRRGRRRCHGPALHRLDVGPRFTDAPLVHTPAGYVEEAALIKSRVKVPVIAVGRIEPELGDRLIREGKADLIAMARKLLADPGLPNKLAEGRPQDVRPCIYCYTCVAQPFFDRPVRCAVNPMTAKEHAIGNTERELAKERRRILVVGGGPAGLEAARIARLRGHEVILCEKSAQLGGTLRFAALVYEPNERLLDWLIDSDVARCRRPTRDGGHAGARARACLDEVLVAAGARDRGPTCPASIATTSSTGTTCASC